MGERPALMVAGAERWASERAITMGRVAAMIVLGAVLAGCDKCGDWWSPMRGQGPGDTQACREQAPPQPQ